MTPRAAGLLLHPTSLPGRYGIGDLGPGADGFLEWAARARQSFWQVLPLGPTAYANAPYGCLSSFAGNPLLISPDRLVEDGLLAASALAEVPSFPAGRLDHPAVEAWKRGLLRHSWESFRRSAPGALRDELAAFVAAPEQAGWLDDWSLFSALKAELGGCEWTAWGRELARREPDALGVARRELAGEIAFHQYLQFLFFRQWARVKAEANGRGIRILGDLPIYVAFDSADVWAHRDLFQLEASGRPLAVAGVPPDDFSATGQLWGNPLYRWERMAEDGFAWWVARVAANLRLADALRLDHFRGFASYWEVPAAEPTAIGGRWRPGPGEPLFAALRAALGELPLVAEDLGMITPDVVELRDDLGLPGMRVLQFGFDDPGSLHAPHHHVANAVVYTGTHDNDTCRGWFGGLDRQRQRDVLDYLGSDGEEIAWGMIRAAYGSVADLAVVPLQDVLGLGSEARMNTPAVPQGNWLWRAEAHELRPEAAARLARLVELTDRRGEHEAAAAAERSTSTVLSEVLERTTSSPSEAQPR